MNNETKKPFYMKWWFIAFVVLVAVGSTMNMLEQKPTDGMPVAEQQAAPKFVPFEMNCDVMYLINDIKLEDLDKLADKKILPLNVNCKISVNENDIVVKTETKADVTYTIVKRVSDALYDIKIESTGATGRCGINRENSSFATDFGTGVIMYAKNK